MNDNGKQIVDIAAFVLPRYRFEWSDNVQRVYKWLEWHWDHGFIQRAFNDAGDLVGVLVARPVMEADEGRIHYLFDPEGPVIFVDVLVCDHPYAIRALWSGLLKRFGRRRTIAWSRDGSPIRSHDTERMDRRLKSEEIYGR